MLHIACLIRAFQAFSAQFLFLDFVPDYLGVRVSRFEMFVLVGLKCSC